MSRVKSVFLVAASLTALAGAVVDAQSGSARASAGEVCLGFSEGIRLAADRAPEVSAAEARLDAAEADLREARSLRRPQVSTFGRTSSGDTGLTSNRLENQVGVQVSQRVYDFGDARLAIEAARGGVDQREYEILSQRLTAAATLADAYLTRLEALSMIEVIGERRSYFRRQQRAVMALLERGGATRADRAQIDAQFARAEADAMELRFLADRAETRIREYSGRSGLNLCPGDRAEAELRRALGPLDSIDGVISAALSHNPEIAARTSAIRSLEAQRERQRRARLPVVEAVGIMSYVYDDLREDWDARDRVGVDVSVPLYTGDALGARVDRAQAELEIEESTLRALQRGVREEAEIAFRRMLSLQSQLVRREAVEDSQREYFEAIAGEFEFGLGTLPDLIDARLAYEQAQLDVISARYSMLRQQLALLQITARMPAATAQAMVQER